MKNKKALSIFLLAALMMPLAGCIGGSGGVPTLPITVVPVCIDFNSYADGTTFGNPFTLNGYQIASPNTEPFVNDLGPNVLALQFPDSNIEVDLPAPASTVDLEILSGAPSPTHMDITAFDSSNGVVTTATVPADRTVYPVTLSGNDMVKVTITGGTGEGGIVKICSS